MPDGVGYCRQCDIVQQNPFPSDERLSKIYDDQYFTAWGDSGDPREHWKLKISLFRASIPDDIVRCTPKPRALDVGCGTGACLYVFQERGYEAFGLDINAEAIRQSKLTVPEAQVLNVNVDNLPADWRKFDLVVMSDVIEHVRDPKEILRTISRIMAPEGVLLILTPDIGSLSARILGRYWPHLKPEHLVMMSRQSMKDALEGVGFSSINLRRCRKPLSINYVASYLSRYPVPGLGHITKWMARVLSNRLSNYLIHSSMGEMLVTAVKENKGK